MRGHSITIRVRRGLKTIRAALMAGVCLGTVAAHATDGTWSLVPADNNWNNAANWSSNPVVPNGTAIFSFDSSQMSITFSAPSTFIQSIQFLNPSTTPYSFSLTSGSLTVTGTGIDLVLVPPAPTFTQSSIGILAFTGSASASTHGSQGNVNRGA